MRAGLSLEVRRNRLSSLYTGLAWGTKGQARRAKGKRVKLNVAVWTKIRNEGSGALQLCYNNCRSVGSLKDWEPMETEFRDQSSFLILFCITITGLAPKYTW